MYNPSLLADLAVKNGAKIKRSTKEINDAILASPQAKIVPFNTPANFFKRDTSFEVSEGSDTITVSFAATVSAPVSTHIGDTALTEVEYGRYFDCEAELNIATMRIKEGTLRIVDFRVSNEEMASNRERLTKEAEQQVRERVFSRQHVANYVTGLPYGEHANPIYPPNSDETPDCGDSMDYVQAVRLGLVDNPEPWLQALVDDLRDQCRALFDGDETYCDPASAEAGNGSFSNDLYPIRDRIHNIILAGMCGEGEWAVYAPLIRAVTPKTVRKLYRLPEELPLLKVDELPFSAEDTKTLGELLSTMELIGVSTPDQGKLVEHYQRLWKLHEGFTHYAELWERLAEGDAGEDVVTRIADYNEQVNSVGGDSDAVVDRTKAMVDALGAVEHTLKANGVLRYLYKTQEKRGKVKPLHDLDCLTLGAYVQDSPDADSLTKPQGDKPLHELNSFFHYECEFAQAEGKKEDGEHVYSDNADFLTRYFPFPAIACIRAVQPPYYYGGNMSNDKLATMTISALTHDRKPWTKNAHRALMEAFVAAGAYDVAYADAHSDTRALTSSDLSAIEPHCEVLDLLLEASKTLYEDLDARLSPYRADTVFEVARKFIDNINSVLPLLGDLHGLNKQWLTVKNHLLRVGSSMGKDYLQEQEQRIPVVELMMEKLSLTDADLERVGLSRQLLLGEGEALSEFLMENRVAQEGGNKPYVAYQFILPDHWSFVLEHPDPRDIKKTLFKVEVPMSMIGGSYTGVQEEVVAELIRAFNYSNPSRRDIVFTKEESEKILDYVRTGNLDASSLDKESQPSYWDTFGKITRKAWKRSPIAQAEDQEALIRGSILKLDRDCHIVIGHTIADVDDDGKDAADERVRLANRLEADWVYNFRLNAIDMEDTVIAVGGTTKGDTSVWNGKTVPHFRGTVGDLFDADERGYLKLYKEAEFCGADPRTQCTYWWLGRKFQYDFVGSHATKRQGKRTGFLTVETQGEEARFVEH